MDRDDVDRERLKPSLGHSLQQGLHPGQAAVSHGSHTVRAEVRIVSHLLHGMVVMFSFWSIRLYFVLLGTAS